MVESGIIVVNKAKDMTSHDCVGIIRHALKIKRVGHTGTLDPMATGVLPICIGKATKVADYISAGVKEYIAGFKLGEKRDTLDIWGKVVKKAPVNVTEEEVYKTVMSFLGDTMQVPPMYSAKKIKGKKLYQLAREGIEIDREPVKITVSEIELLKCDILNNEFEIRVICSKGTYIRSLIDDLGEKLKCYACMTSLVRTRSGKFNIKNPKIVDIFDIKKHGAELCYKNIIPVDKVFLNYKEVILPYNQEIRYKNGIYIKTRDIGLNDAECDDIFRVYNTVGEFIALGNIIEDETKTKVLRVMKSFY